MKSPSWTIFWGIVSATVGKHTLPDLYNLTLSRPGFFPQRLGFWFLQPTSSVAAFRQNAGEYLARPHPGELWLFENFITLT